MQSSIGALELKESYQKHLAAGVTVAAMLSFASVGGAELYKALQERNATAADGEGPVIIIKSTSEISPPPSIVGQKPQIQFYESEAALPSIGIPIPVPDEEVVEDVKFATRDELAQFNMPDINTFHGSGSGNVIVDIQDKEYFPSPEEFVAVQEMPVLIRGGTPVYPEIAMLTGREGKVFIKALIDSEGRVREARVAKSSGTNVGFDEAALEAAQGNIYKPAIQNGKPVPVWITYPVVFSLKDK